MTLASLATGIPASAASTTNLQNTSLQKEVNAAFAQIAKTSSLDTNADLIINLTGQRGNGSSGNDTVHISLNARRQPSGSPVPNSEGRLLIDKLQVESTGGSTAMPITPDAPIALQWKIVGGTIYGRVEELPSLLTGALKSLGKDPSALVGTWVNIGSVGTDGVTNIPGMSLAQNLPAGIPTPAEISAIQNLESTPLVLVRSIESQWVGADGHSIIRVRGSINPAVTTALRRLETIFVPTGTPNRAAKIKQLDTQLTAVRKFLSGTQVAINLDQTTRSISRLELGGTTTMRQPTGCSVDPKTKKSVCQTTPITIRYAVGISFTKDTGPQIQAPANAVPLKDLLPTQTTATHTP